jgi:hypothetical protein
MGPVACDYPIYVGWVRQGTWDGKDGCAFVLSKTEAGWKSMFVGQLHHGEVWADVVNSAESDGSLAGIRLELSSEATSMEGFTAIRCP